MGIATGDRKTEVGFVNGDTLDCRKKNLFVGRHIDVMQGHGSLQKGCVYANSQTTFAATKQIYGQRHYFVSFPTKAEAEQAIREHTVRVMEEIAAAAKAKKPTKPNKE